MLFVRFKAKDCVNNNQIMCLGNINEQCLIKILRVLDQALTPKARAPSYYILPISEVLNIGGL